MWIHWSFLEGGTKYPWEELQRQSVEQRLKERTSRDCPTWGSIPYTVTKLKHYCGFQKVLPDRSLIKLSPERLCQCLTNTEMDALSHPWTEHRVPNEGARERTQGAEGVCSPIGGTTIWTNQYPQSSQGLNHQYIARDPCHRHYHHMPYNSLIASLFLHVKPLEATDMFFIFNFAFTRISYIV